MVSPESPGIPESPLEWCYIEFPWRYDKEMEKMLKDKFPFRSVKEHFVPTYVFDKSVDNH